MLVQTVLVVTAILALYLVGQPDKESRARAGIVGMAGQPLWLYTAYMNDQHGIVIISLFYTYSWWRVYENNK